MDVLCARAPLVVLDGAGVMAVIIVVVSADAAEECEEATSLLLAAVVDDGEPGDDVLDVSTIRPLVLTDVDEATRVLEPISGVTLVAAGLLVVAWLDAALPLPFPLFPAFGQRLLVPWSAKNAFRIFSPVMPLLLQADTTFAVNALSAVMQELEHFPLVKSEGWQPSICVV